MDNAGEGPHRQGVTGKEGGVCVQDAFLRQTLVLRRIRAGSLRQSPLPLPPSQSEGVFSQGSLLSKAGASVFPESSKEEDSAA